MVAALGLRLQRMHRRLRQRHRQEPVLEAVLVDDVGERRGDHAAHAIVQKRPGRVLAAGATAEVLAADQQLDARVRRLVQDEIGPWPPLAVEAEVVEEALAEPLALDGLQELLGDDLVRVQVGDRQRRGAAVEAGKGAHQSSPAPLALMIRFGPPMASRTVKTLVPGLRPLRNSETSSPAAATRACAASGSGTRQAKPPRRSSSSLTGAFRLAPTSTMASPQRKNSSREPQSGFERSSRRSRSSFAP